MVKYVKSVRVEVQVSEDLINELNELYGDYNDYDYHELGALEGILDEFITISSFNDLPRSCQWAIEVKRSSGLVDDTDIEDLEL